MIQLVECLPSKCKILNASLRTDRKKKSEVVKWCLSISSLSRSTCIPPCSSVTRLRTQAPSLIFLPYSQQSPDDFILYNVFQTYSFFFQFYSLYHIKILLCHLGIFLFRNLLKFCISSKIGLKSFHCH
jgi:hypothetical protein